MFGWIKRLFGSAKQRIKATYDAAQTTSDNARLWSGADQKSPASSVDPHTRAMLRSRARYEVENNSYAAGIADTLATYTIGRGPRLHLRTSGNRVAARDIEREWHEWTQSIALAEKLRTAKKAQVVDGEAFLLRTRNPRIDSLLDLDYTLIEADQVATAFVPTIVDEVREVDGIRFDRYGNPKEYGILSRHPGAQTTAPTLDTTWVRAERMIHYFRVDRPNQPRGVSHLAPALSLFILLRQYTKATVEAAAAAAYWMAVIHSQGPADDSEPVAIEDDDFSVFDLERNAAMKLPEGWNVSQLKPEHPTTVYPEFKREVVNEIARALNVPFNLAAGNSSEYNFASGRLDWQAFFRTIQVDRTHLERVCLDRIWFDWLAARESAGLPGVPDSAVPVWTWDGFSHLDPKDEAEATNTLATGGFLNEDEYWAMRGTNTEDALDRMEEIAQMRADRGLPQFGGTPAGMGMEQPNGNEQTPEATPQEAPADAED